MPTTTEAPPKRRFLGGHDAAALCGFSPYNSPLDVWLSKTYRYKEDVTGPAVHWGKLLEPVLAQEYARQRKVRLEKVPEPTFHPEYTFMGSWLDRRIKHAPRQAWEGKTTSRVSEWKDGPPMHVQIQMQHYMAVESKLDFIDVSVLLLPSREFSTYRVQRNEAFIESLTKMEADWWAAFVEPDVEPPARWDYPGLREALARLYPEPTGQVVELPPDLAALEDDFVRLVAQLAEARAHVNILNDEKKAIEDRILSFMLDADTATAPGGTFHRTVIPSKEVAFTRKPYIRFTYKPMKP